MKTHTSQKKTEQQSQSRVHPSGEKQQNGSSPLQKMANQSSRVMQLKALQDMANSNPVQLFKGADGTNQAGADIPFTFAQDFTGKHIAADETAAIANTRTRIDDSEDAGGQLVKAGTIGNTVATNATWTSAINANTDVVPEDFMGPSAEDQTDPGYNASDYNDSGRTKDSSYMQISGWEVTYDSGNDELNAEQKTVNRRVSGPYAVTNLNVSMDIDHCTQ